MAGLLGRGWRTSLTVRLLAGGLAVTVILVTAVSGFLLVSRAQQTDHAVRSEAANRSATGYQLLLHVTEPETQYAATSLATAAGLQTALAAPDVAGRAAAVAGAFTSGVNVQLAGSQVTVFDAAGHAVYTDECGAGLTTPACEARPGAHVATDTPSTALAMAEGRRAACAVPAATPASECPKGYEGVDLIGGEVPAFDAAVDVRDSAHRFLGVVVYSTTLQTQFHRLGAALLYAPVVISEGSAPRLYRYDPQHDYSATHSAAASQLGPVLAHRPADFTVEYPTAASGSVASSFLGLTGPDGQVAAYLGVEVPVSVFAGQTDADERTIVLIGITAIILVFLLIATFASRFVVRPIARLERGVHRIAGGDLSQDVPVTRHDELGRLASSVNRMRAQIAGYIGHLDGSIARLESVSHALTTTGDGVDALQDSVVGAAEAIGGDGTVGRLYTTRDGGLVSDSGSGDPARTALAAAESAAVLSGRHVRRAPRGDGGALLAVPMLYHDEARGALVVTTPAELPESDERALAALANNASVALENTRLFEQERNTVLRLRELDIMKSNFLTTTQHELRTPVLAIKGEIELISSAWQQLDEPTRLELVRDMEVSARLLGEIVENIVVFSLLNTEAIALDTEPVDVAAAVNRAAAQLRENHRDQLPVDLSLNLAPGLEVVADRERFEQVIRALLDNAVKFSPAGGHVWVLSRVSGATCRIDVVDEGIGMDSEVVPTVFDHLTQADGSRTRRYGGMGMGLALVRRLSEAHGAEVSVASAPGEGTCLTLRWPLAVPSSASARAV